MLSMAPVAGDFILFLWLPYYVFGIFAHLLHKRKQVKRENIKELKRKIDALEKSIQDHEPETLKKSNEAMLRAMAEVEAFSKKL